MKIYLFSVLLIICSLASANHITILTAAEAGTFHAVGKDMVKACGKDTHMVVESTPGSIANLNRIIKAPAQGDGYRFAFVQQDVLLTVPSSSYTVVTPLYDGEITIIVRKKTGIYTVTDLHGKKVAIGEQGSGNAYTATLIKKNLGLQWIEYRLTREKAIIALLTGEIDAAIVVGGVPLEQFQELGRTISSRVAIISLYAPSLDLLYKTKQIPANSFKWANYPVETKSTLTLLIASKDVPDTVIKEFKSCLVKSLPALQRFGHPKWKEISQHIRPSLTR